jgi:hypothetical protein
MPKRLIYVTGFETVRVTRGYLCETEDEAVAKLSKWMQVQTDERGRDFGGTVRVEIDTS